MVSPTRPRLGHSGRHGEGQGGGTGGRSAKTRLEKIRKAYEFVSALRYVAIEFGVNGIRPRTPAVVLQNRYGDCKDKANLLIALLANMGIDGQFVLLNRFSSTDVDFPSWQFNHAIAYVPKAPDAGQPDDLWLDTTDSTAPFPTLSPGDIGRNALVFDKDSGQFLTVTAPGKEVTEVIEEHWKFKAIDQNRGRSSTAHCRKHGPAWPSTTCAARCADALPVTGTSSCKQNWRDSLPNADFSKLESNARRRSLDSHAPRCASQHLPSLRPSPRTGFDVAAYFAPPERDRPLLINNGQKLHLLQTVEWTDTFNHHRIRPPFDQQTAGIHATITWNTHRANPDPHR